MNFIQDQRLKIWMQHPDAIRRLPKRFGIHLKNKHPIATIKTKKTNGEFCRSVPYDWGSLRVNKTSKTSTTMTEPPNTTKRLLSRIKLNIISTLAARNPSVFMGCEAS